MDFGKGGSRGSRREKGIVIFEDIFYSVASQLLFVLRVVLFFAALADFSLRPKRSISDVHQYVVYIISSYQ